MIPQICSIKQNPPESYGDCIRACIASILDMDCENVPHLVDVNGYFQLDEMRAWLADLGYGLAYMLFDGETSRDEMLQSWGIMNPGIHAMLMAQTASGGDHAVIVYGDKIVHDPAWIRSPIVAANSNGYWNFFVLCVL